MRASRLLSILMLLQTRGRTTAQALADELETSIRTIYRDIDQLSAAGVPVVVLRGATGGFELLDGWRTRLTGLLPIEAQALFVSGLPGPAAQLGLGDAMASAKLKLMAALPAAWQAEAQRVSTRFHLDPLGWYRSAARSDFLPAIADAVWNNRRLKIRYQRWRGVVKRTVDPLGLVLKAGDWYVVGRAQGKPRTYRVSNILALAPTKERFERSMEFDLAGYWVESTQRFERELYRATALVRVSPRGRTELRSLSAAVAEAVDGSDAPADDQGWMRITIPIESIDHAAQEILKLGSEAEVLEPEALRERLADTVRRLAAIYQRRRTGRRRRA